jgi:hypothetical protein
MLTGSVDQGAYVRADKCFVRGEFSGTAVDKTNRSRSRKEGSLWLKRLMAAVLSAFTAPIARVSIACASSGVPCSDCESMMPPARAGVVKAVQSNRCLSMASSIERRPSDNKQEYRGLSGDPDYYLR